ncbi:MAG: hypothetical protein OEX01_01615 [Candidatus Bathyarchaeota archaeon]|nr:hypothetical protein [Candidatus Bathyarchaeota archaeon]
MKICPSTSSLGVAVRVEIRGLSAVKLVDEVESGKLINFDVRARMEEKERRSDWVSVGFTLSVGTKPNVVKFEVEGTATLEGKNEEIKKMLEADPETQIPLVFQRVYQHVFTSMYLLATLIDAPYPPANLLYSSQQQMPIVQMNENSPTIREETTQTAEPATALEESAPPQSIPSAAPPEETATSEQERTVEAAAENQETQVVQPEKEEVSTEA